MPNKQKIIIYVLAIILALVSLGAFWDLYGREHICIGSCTNAKTSLPTASQLPSSQVAPSTKEAKQPKANVDPSLYSSCTAVGTVNKACKDCCDGLSADTAVIQACKKSCNAIGQ